MTPEDLALRNAAARYLGEIQTLRKAVVRQKMELDRLRHELTGLKAIVYDKDKVMTSPVNTLEEQMVRLDEITTKYAEKLAEMYEAIRIREEQIGRMPKVQHREILTERYLRQRRKSFDIIARDINRSDDWVRHLHTEALLEFAKMYKLDTKPHI